MTESVRLFSDKGFHGISMRNIASAAKCSLPMLYYYFKNKEELFYEVAYKEFILLIERLNSSVKTGETIDETYLYAIKQRKGLSDYDKAVYKLSLKVWLSFDGESKVRKDLIKWENMRRERTKNIWEKYIGNKEQLPVFTEILVRVMENMIEKIILLDEDLPDEDIKKEIAYLKRAINN